MSEQPTWPPRLPANETPEERLNRLEEETQAKVRSHQIDKEISKEKEEKNKKNRAKILLLGQAESGKSTVLKNFQLQFAPKAFEAEASIWRPVIHLNLVRSANFIVNFANKRLDGYQEALSHSDMEPAPNPQDIEVLRQLCSRLAPLSQVEQTLSKLLTGPSFATHPNVLGTPKYNPAKASEVSVPSGYSWKKGLIDRTSNDSASASLGGGSDFDYASARQVLSDCTEDIVALWKSKCVRKGLKLADIALEEQPGFFLNQAARITAEDYKPTPDDILKARVTTSGPEEHTIVDEGSFARHWTIYDVGGSRSQRAAWAQFFDDVNMIIFLAPMSGFNQVLAEDDSVNRLTDSFTLWKTICSNKILENLEFVIFLNKLDILQAKLKAGIQFSQFVASYVDKPNETKPVAKYLLDVFASLHQKHSPRKRKLHPHLTCAVDTNATASVIARIREMILVRLLSSTNVL